MSGGPKYTYIYRCIDCGHRDNFPTELNEGTRMRCSKCRGFLVYVTRRRR